MDVIRYGVPCAYFFLFKQKTAYEMRISDWSSDVCSSDLRGIAIPQESSSPNAAKLLMDCILSAEGQKAVADGDYTAYRPDVADEAKWHLQTVLDEVGEEKALFVS